ACNKSGGEQTCRSCIVENIKANESAAVLLDDDSLSLMLGRDRGIKFHFYLEVHVAYGLHDPCGVVSSRPYIVIGASRKRNNRLCAIQADRGIVQWIDERPQGGVQSSGVEVIRNRSSRSGKTCSQRQDYANMQY